MASRVTRSFHSIRQPINSLSLSSSFKRIFSAASSSPILPSPSFSRTTQLLRYSGFGSEFGEETAIKVKGQAYSLASFNSGFTSHLSENRRLFQPSQSFYRSFASTPVSESRQKQTEKGNKAISTVEDPFDSPTYHIPEKPVSFTEGASYSLVILSGLGIAGVAAYGVFKELIFEPKEYKIFNKALEKIQHDGQVKVRIGSPIKGYGQESRNRAARQRIPHRVWTDEDGVEHVEVNFHIRGPHGDGKVYCEMFKDKSDNQWKYMYLIVDVLHPSPTKLFLESFLPA